MYESSEAKELYRIFLQERINMDNSVISNSFSIEDSPMLKVFGSEFEREFTLFFR